MRKKLFLILIFGCIGVTGEIIFTGLKYNLVLPLLQNEKINYALTGTSYIWMFFIYGAIPLLFPLIYSRIKELHLIIRISVYAIICLAVEYLSGFILDIVTGDCPWRYTTGWHVNGYIRLDYFPVWLFFGYVIEKTWLYCKNHVR